MTEPSFPSPAAPPRLDVRPMLAEGIDPYDSVLALAEAIAEDGALEIDAPFNPTPLRRVMARHGFSSRATRLATDWWRVRFVRDGAANWAAETETTLLPEGAMRWTEEDGIHLDVRRLSPPEPLRLILGLIDSLGQTGGPVVVHHDRDPLFLPAELAERGWRIARVEPAPADLRLWLEPERR